MVGYIVDGHFLIVEIGKQCTDTEFTFLADVSC